MPAPRSRRARILTNLERQLETITVTNGYTIDVKDCTTHVRNWMETAEAETPVLYLVDEKTKYNYHAGKLTDREWYIAIYGVMKNKSQVQMEELIADIEECLFKNMTLSFDGEIPGPASYIKIEDITTDNQLFSEVEGSQLFKMLVNIRYTACLDQIR